MGISPVYRKWRLDRGLPIGPPQQEVTKTHAPNPEVKISVPEPEINEAVSPTVPVLSALDRMKNPVVLDKGPRETIWNTMYGDGPHVGAICGPFEIIIPSWLDFEGLVCGKDGGLIDQIHDGTIAPYQRISWYNTGGRPFALVVGLSADVNPRSLSVQYCMRDLWSGVLQWVIEAYNGGTVSLATFLRVRLVAYRGGESPNLNNEARIAYQNIESNVPLAKREALSKREYMAACFPVVNAIIQKPLEDANRELTAWVLCPEANERHKRFLAAREIWWSSSSSPEVIANGFKWVASFALPATYGLTTFS